MFDESRGVCCSIPVTQVWPLCTPEPDKIRVAPWYGKKICLPMQEMRVRSLGQEDPLEKEMAPHSSALAWEIPQTVEPGRLWSTRSQKSRTTTEKDSFISLPGKQEHTGLLPRKTRCLNSRGLMKRFIAVAQRWGL